MASSIIAKYKKQSLVQAKPATQPVSLTEGHPKPEAKKPMVLPVPIKK